MSRSMIDKETIVLFCITPIIICGDIYIITIMADEIINFYNRRIKPLRKKKKKSKLEAEEWMNYTE